MRQASKNGDGSHVGDLGDLGVYGGRARVDLEGAHTLDGPLEFAQPARHFSGSVGEHVPVLLPWTADLETEPFSCKHVGDTDNGVRTERNRLEQWVLWIRGLETMKRLLAEDKVASFPLLAGEERPGRELRQISRIRRIALQVSDS